MNIPVKKVTDKEMELKADARFINFINALASKHGVTVTECDTKNRVIQFKGDQANVDAFAQELCDVLEVVEEKPGQEVIDQWPSLK
jgi:hypothetical protein